MRKTGVKLTFLVSILLTLTLIVASSCSADLNRLLFGFVAEVRDSKGVHEFETIQAGIDYVIQRNKDSGKVLSASRAIDGIDEEDTVYLIRDVDGDWFKGARISVKDYTGKLAIDFQDYEYCFENDTEDGKFFDIQAGIKVNIKGGHTIIKGNNPSGKAALIVNTDTVTLTDHFLDDRRVHGKITDEGKETEWVLTNAVEVQSNGHLVVDGEKSQLGSVIGVKTGGVFEIENCKLTKIYKLDEEAGTGNASVTIKGGEIEHPHSLGDRIRTAIGTSTGVKHGIIHVPSDFVYERADGAQVADRTDIESSVVHIYSKVFCWCNKTEECKTKTKGYATMVLEDPYDPVWRGELKKPCYISFENWQGKAYETKDILYKGNDRAGEGVGYLVFRNNDSPTGAATYCGLKFTIEDGSGYGGIDVNLPEDVKIDTTKPVARLDFADGVISAVKTGGGDIKEYQWQVDDKTVKEDGTVLNGDKYTEGVPSNIDLRTFSAEKSHKVVLYVRNKAGQSSCSMNVYVPEGELENTQFRQQKNGVVKNDLQTMNFMATVIDGVSTDERKTVKSMTDYQITGWKWYIDGTVQLSGNGAPAELALPSLAENDPDTTATVTRTAEDGTTSNFNIAVNSTHSVKLELTYWGNVTCTYEKTYTVRSFDRLR